MVEALIGAGGWSYFNVVGDRLRNYARAFRTVEVNSTYYRIPLLPIVESWRRRVPEGFEFTVRCNRKLIQDIRFESPESSLETYHRMRGICSILNANILHIQTPPDFKLNKDSIKKIDDFLSTISTRSPRLAWEIRSPQGAGYQRLLSILESHYAIHSVDLSKENPAYESDIIYSRLFGKGQHNIYQFTNDDMREIDGKVKTSKASKAYLNFHGMRMYKDAARISVYEATGTFPKVTRGIGVESVLEVLKEDNTFPVTTSELIRSQGWKVCEWKDDKQLRLSEILCRIEEKRFSDIHELELELRRI